MKVTSLVLVVPFAAPLSLVYEKSSDDKRTDAVVVKDKGQKKVLDRRRSH
ncbi:MAG: hypothetical protein ACK5TR_06390 [Alphaproteobacteria bacterium]|jgi:hypothetical protein|nr:hypothetical protein [Alphaproteobacteria bacterium]